MRVLVLTPYLYGTTAGPRSSFELWDRVLEPEGIHLHYAPFESERLHEIIYRDGHLGAKAAEMVAGSWRRLRLMSEIDEFDAVLVNREANLIGPAVLERWIARQGKPVIYQLDDPLYVPYRSPSNGYLSYLKFFGKVKSICRLSKVVIVNSTQHQEFARRHASDVRLIPSLVDGSAYRYERRSAGGDGPLTVGWTGSGSTAPNLREILGVLQWLSERDDVRLRFIGSDEFDLPGVRYSAAAWDPAIEVDSIREFDIGLLPLPVTPWSVRKFYLKLVQYMALGIPAVCAPLGSNPDVIADGVTGFLANDEEEWKRTLDELIGSPERREEVGEAAAARAHAEYTLEANAEKIIAAFRAATS